MAKIYNEGSNTLLSGTSGDDSIQNGNWDEYVIGGFYVTINTGSGNDEVYNGRGNYCSINTGAGNDYVDNHEGDSVTINTGAGKDSVDNYGDSVTINTGSGNDEVYNGRGNYCSINTGAGNDCVDNYGGDLVTINTGEGKDSVQNGIYSYSVTINTGAGNDYVYNYSESVTINTGEGNDSVLNPGSSVTISGGKGNDSIYNNWTFYSNKPYANNDGSKVLFQYAEGDGNDIIYGFKADSTLSISGGSYSSTKSGDDIIFTVDDGKISLIGAASLSAVNVKFKETVTETNTWKFSGTTATYGTSTNTLVTVKGVKDTVGLSIDDKVVTVAASSLNKKKVTISGDGYTLKLADDVSAPSTKKAAWTIDGTTATYKSSYKTAGYTLASDSKSISYTSATTATDLATVKGVKSTKGLSISGKVITVAASSLNKKKVTISGEGYTLKLADDVSAPSTKKAAWTLSDSTATYKSSYKTAGYKLASNGKSISYSSATTATTLASVKGAKAKPTISNDVIKLKTSTINSKVTLSGSYEFDFASGDYNKAKITGSSSADRITSRGKNISINGGAGNDTIKIYGSATSIKGGNGADVFVFDGGSGVITDYAAEDKISIVSGTVEATMSGDNVILTAGGKKITVKGGKDKTITYFDASGEHSYPEVDDETVALPKTYSKESYTMGDEIFTVDASAVRRDLKIVGNDFANSIIGSTQNDTIIGGKSNDTLTGGDGSDIFVWNKGDGNDVITDYAEDDMISIKGDSVKSFKASSDDVVITLASKSKITVAGGKDKLITYVDAKGEHIYPEIFTIKGKTITLTDEYTKKSFAVDDYGSYTKVDASEVGHGLSIVGNDSANSIMGTTDDDTIDGGAGKDTIRGNEGNDSIVGGTGNDSLWGGVGSDSLIGGKGNDWLWGGEGSDVFIYSNGDGNDTIFDYNARLDKIVVQSGTVDNVSENADGDLVFTVGTGKIILDGMAGKYAKVVNSKGATLKEYIP